MSLSTGMIPLPRFTIWSEIMIGSNKVDDELVTLVGSVIIFLTLLSDMISFRLW